VLRYIRKLKKRDMRSVWIQKVNAGSRDYDVRYNQPSLASTNVCVSGRKSCAGSLQLQRRWLIE
jgi:ribosomal protein L20